LSFFSPIFNDCRLSATKIAIRQDYSGVFLNNSYSMIKTTINDNNRFYPDTNV